MAGRTQRQWVWGLGIVALLRCFAAFTHSTYHHPDEWFQTVEFGNLLANGLMSHTQEVALHLRNLSWPAIIAAILTFCEWVAPGSPGTRAFFIQAGVGILSLGLLWGFWQLGKKEKIPPPWIAIFLLLPWFSIWDSIRPSQENLSTIALWITLGLVQKRLWFFSGVGLIAIGAFRYPSGLFSLGILIALFFDSRFLKTRGWSSVLGGMVTGAILFGSADWIFYGRPWESLWMYLQYNVFTGLSHQNFGSQTMEVYWTYFQGHWGKTLLPLGILLAIGLPIGLREGFQKKAPWFFSFLFYFIGHLLVQHKEPRFMAPLEGLVVFAGILGLMQMPDVLKFLKYPFSRKLIPAYLLFCGLISARELWGQMWVAPQTYFEVDQHLRKVPTCGVITVRRPLSVFLPRVPLGYFPTHRRTSSFQNAKEIPLAWVEKAPRCKKGENILLHLHHPEPNWGTQGCELLPSGVLRVIPKSHWNFFLKRGLASGSWFSCPRQILSVFSKRHSRKVIARRFERIESLPSLGTSGEDLQKIRTHSRYFGNLADGTFGDL